MLFRTVPNLKRMDCLFLNSPLNIFGPWLTMGNSNHRKQNQGYGQGETKVIVLCGLCFVP